MNRSDSLWLIALPVVVSVASVLGTYVFRKIASPISLVAVPNERTLHEGSVPSGGGVVFATLHLVAVGALLWTGRIETWFATPLLVGGAAIGVVGLIDDRWNVKRRFRLATHAGLSLMILLWVGGLPPIQAGAYTVDLGVFGDIVAFVSLTWFINLYNFMDGADGMAASGTVFFAAVTGSILLLEGFDGQALVLYSLASATLGFLVFNWPPASIFMGDTGSGFLGFNVGTILMLTVAGSTLELWTWLILLGYFLSDTGVTLLLRIARLGSKFYDTHRQHAYQNLARVKESHLLVTGLVTGVHLLWLLPLAVASRLCPDWAPALTLVAFLPLVVFAVRFGPLYER